MIERLRTAIDDAAVALIFLTRIPVPWRVDDVEGRLARATPWFPLVGVVVGGLGALAWWLGTAIGNPVVGAFAAVAATLLVTGAFHEDGLADTADGLGGSPERDRALAIMKDSRVGTYGAAALILSLVGRIVVLTSLGSLAPLALIGGHALARYSTLPLIDRLPYARAGDGIGKPFAGGVTGRGLLLSGLLTLALTLLLWGPAAFAVWLVAGAVLWLLARWFRRRLGGITGDTLGAANQGVELTAYLVLLAVLQ